MEQILFYFLLAIILVVALISIRVVSRLSKAADALAQSQRSLMDKLSAAIEAVVQSHQAIIDKFDTEFRILSAKLGNE